MVNHSRLVKRKEEAKNNHVNKKDYVIGTWANFLTELTSSLKENTWMFMVTLSQRKLFKQNKKLLVAIPIAIFATFCNVTSIMSLPFEESEACNDYTGSSKTSPFLLCASLPCHRACQHRDPGKHWKENQNKEVWRWCRSWGQKKYIWDFPKLITVCFFSGGCSYLQMLLSHEMFWKRLDYSNF